MSSDSENPDAPEENASQEASAEESESSATDMVRSDESEVIAAAEGEDETLEAGHVGVERYVHAAFFAAGILTAYLMGKILLSFWNMLADFPDVVRMMPMLIEYGEEQRASYTLVIGAVMGVFLILRYYRRPSVRGWAAQVATELARVTWPSKDTVTSGTIVVLIAGAIATLYIAMLDRLWGYLTNLVYGA